MKNKIKAYVELSKLRVVTLMLVTVVVGMLMATQAAISPLLIINSLLGIALCASSGGAINHFLERESDKKMARTQKRPIPSGLVSPAECLIFAGVTLLLGVIILIKFVNIITTVLTVMTVVGYGIIYTAFLKRATPQNIVIGGLAGAMPPLLGWSAVTGRFDPLSLLLVLIIFVWTPPHFWALAIHRKDEYAKADIPMLPVTHGVEYTKINILLYTIVMIACTWLPFAVGMSGLIYLTGATVLGLVFLWYSYNLWKEEGNTWAMPTFKFSIIYLFALFIALLLDHYI